MIKSKIHDKKARYIAFSSDFSQGCFVGDFHADFSDTGRATAVLVHTISR